MSCSGIFNDSLLDMNLITGGEKNFYEDQKGIIKCQLSKGIDDKSEQERQTQFEQQRDEQQLSFQEESFTNKKADMLELNEQTSSVVLMNSSLNGSGLSRNTTQYIE